MGWPPSPWRRKWAQFFSCGVRSARRRKMSKTLAMPFEVCNYQSPLGPIKIWHFHCPEDSSFAVLWDVTQSDREVASFLRDVLSPAPNLQDGVTTRKTTMEIHMASVYFMLSRLSTAKVYYVSVWGHHAYVGLTTDVLQIFTVCLNMEGYAVT